MERINSPLNVWMYYLEGIDFKSYIDKYIKDAYEAGKDEVLTTADSPKDVQTFDVWRAKYKAVFPIDISYLAYIEKCLLIGIQPIPYKEFRSEEDKPIDYTK